MLLRSPLLPCPISSRLHLNRECHFWRNYPPLCALTPAEEGSRHLAKEEGFLLSCEANESYSRSYLKSIPIISLIQNVCVKEGGRNNASLQVLHDPLRNVGMALCPRENRPRCIETVAAKVDQGNDRARACALSLASSGLLSHRPHPSRAEYE